MQVEVDAEPRFIDVKELTKPSTEEGDEFRIRIRERNFGATFGPVAGIQTKPCHQELSIAELTNPSDALDPAMLDLGRLRPLQPIRATSATPTAWIGHELDISNPTRH